MRMALFPAYSSFNNDSGNNENTASEDPHDVPTESVEMQLLASDSEDDKPTAAPGAEPGLSPSAADYYLDRRLDRGNLRVSTLYYPGRPQYEFRSGHALGAARGARRQRRHRRYFARRAPDPSDAAPAAERADHYRRRLARDPHDAALWESFVDFQEAFAGADAALAAAEEGAARAPEAGRLRTRLLAALRATLPPHAFLDRLRDMLAEERSAVRRTELWEWLLEALAAAPGGDPARLTSAAAAAVADTRSYPRLLHALGSQLAAAGLWERLVLLVELVVAMNLAADAFPRDDPADVERRLQELEDEAVRSGLPLGAVWVRVERARAAARWRPAAAGAGPSLADPQRAPLPHDVAELLLPVAAPDELLHLAVRLLMLAKVPLLPGTQWASAWCGRAPPHHAEALLPLLAEAGALPPAHRAHVPAAAARQVLRLLLDPPHYFGSGAGFPAWTDALWDACCARAAGDALVALLCWRLRWLAALLPLAERGEAARVRARARALLRRTAHPLPFVEFARLERAAAGPARALHAAALALRAALQEPALPAPHALHAARAVAELSAAGAALSAAGRCALVCAALRRPPPAELAEPAPADVAAALDACERECAAAEADAAADDGEPTAAEVLLPARGEWARARALLAAPERRERLLRDACAAAPRAVRAGGRAARYWEEAGAALVAAAAREGGAARAARLLLAHFPDNVRLALEAAEAPLWAWAAAQGPAERLAALSPRGPVSALAALLPPLARAVEGDFAADDAERLVRAARRAARAGSGALLWTVRLEAEARAARPRLAPALYAALDAAPQAKWLYVRGAAWCGGQAAALADALLERQLRLHALPDELRPQ